MSMDELIGCSVNSLSIPYRYLATYEIDDSTSSWTDLNTSISSESCCKHEWLPSSRDCLLRTYLEDESNHSYYHMTSVDYSLKPIAINRYQPIIQCAPSRLHFGYSAFLVMSTGWKSTAVSFSNSCGQWRYMLEQLLRKLQLEYIMPSVPVLGDKDTGPKSSICQSGLESSVFSISGVYKQT